VTATLTCAGNRRAEFNKEGKVGGVQWEAGAIGNAKWTGVRLADVLEMAQLTDKARHVWFEGLDQIKRDNGTIPFGASIPIEKAMQTEPNIGALLVTQMNARPLTADHGFPLRTVVPGYIGARSVKWLGKILVSDQPSTNHYVATAYKIVKQTKPLDWKEAGPIYRFPINAAIAADEELSLKPGTFRISGYVLPSGISGARIRRVQVSTDSGDTWVNAELTGAEQDYCWRLWKAKIEVTESTTQLIARATDNKGGFMPYRVPWNAKGYLQNSWYRVPVKVL
jgi:sulfite oxidase